MEVVFEDKEPPQNMQGAANNVPANQSTSDDCMSECPRNAQSSQHNWQATKPTIKSRIAFLLNNEILSDIHFIVGRGASKESIPAHRFILSTGSAVFDTMFNSSLATKSDEVELPDIEPAAFHALLSFLYTDDVHIGPETVMTTLYTAKKYVVPALEKICVDFLQSNLCSDNAFLLLEQARLFDEPQLLNLCLDTIDKNTASAFAADGFTDVDLDTLCFVLERSTLSVEEIKVFEAATRWAVAECRRQQLPVTIKNQRSVLGRAVFLIRFPLMSVEEFARVVAQSGLLTDQEVVQLFLYFTLNPKPAVGFLDAPRTCVSDREQTVCRFTQVESRWGYNGNSDRVRFVTDRQIFVRGFGLYGSVARPAEYDVKIQISHLSGEVVGSHKTSFACDGSKSTFRVMFEKPVEVQPNIVYTIAATLIGPDSYYGTKGLRSVTLDCPSSGKITFQFSYQPTNNNGTAVEDGQIPEIIFYTC